MGDFYQIAETEDIIYIGTDLPDEYSGSNYTKHIKGTIAKAKANAAQAIPEMNEIATARDAAYAAFSTFIAEERPKGCHTKVLRSMSRL